MSGSNPPATAEEFRRRSSLLKAERCAIVMTDQDEVADAVRVALRDTGLTFYRTTTAEETIRTARAPFVQIFVLDLRVPGALDAVRVTARIRTDLSPAPVIAIGVGEARQEVLDAGAVMLFPTDLDISALRASARVLLGSAER